MIIGEEKAWEKVSKFDPLDVCKRSGVSYNSEDGNYMLKSFGMKFLILPQTQEIKNMQTEGEILLKRYGYFFNLSVLCYLINAQDRSLSGRLVKPVSLKGGDIFFRGSHVLPLHRITEMYGNDRQGFIEKGKEMGGKVLGYGDASVELLPLPRIPVTLILWLCDDEFPARADLLFDSTCELQVPLDIIWSIAMMSVLVML